MSRWTSDGHVQPPSTASAANAAATSYGPQTTIIKQPPPTNAPAGAEDRLVFLGPDQDGTLLEVMAIETDRGLLDPRHADARQVHPLPGRTRCLAASAS